MSHKPATSTAPADASPVRRWSQEILSGTVAQRRQAADSLAEIVPVSPAIIKLFVQALGDRDQAVAARVSRALKELGAPASRPLQDALRDPATDAGVLKAVARTLAALMPESAVHKLIENLLCGDVNTRCEAAVSLGDLGKGAREAVPALAWALRHAPDTKVRVAAGAALSLLGPAVPTVIPTLIRVIEGEPGMLLDPNRLAALNTHAEVLGKIGTPAAVTALLKLLSEHADAGIRRLIATCLGAITPPVLMAVEPLVAALADDCPTVRDAATRALIAINEIAVPDLTTALKSPQAEVRHRSAMALGRMAPASRDVVEALAKAMHDADNRVVLQAAVAILKIMAAHESIRQAPKPQPGRGKATNRLPEDQQALAVLVEVVRQRKGDSRARQEAAEALGRLGPEAKAAGAALAEVAADTTEDRLVRQSAWWAWQRIAPEDAAKTKSP